MKNLTYVRGRYIIEILKLQKNIILIFLFIIFPMKNIAKTSIRILLREHNIAFKSVLRTIPLFSTFHSKPLIYKPSFSFTQYHSIPKSHQIGEGYYLEQMLVNCLALYSYYVESEGEAVIIDPINDIQSYKKLLQSRKSKLKYILLTHFHADYVAGHLELQRQFPSAQIIMGEKANVSAYKGKIAPDNSYINFGTAKIQAIHTPGHTEQSTCFLLYDKNGKATDLFSGDTLFLGEVGRPDLAVKSNLTSTDLAYMLFDSLSKLKKLPDDVKVFPGHGAGSACGKNISKGDFCTLGTQKQNNYALKINTKQTFAQQILRGMPNPPSYFFNVVKKNKQEPFVFQEVFNKSIKPLSIQEFQNIAKNPNTQVIDIRDDNNQFISGTIKGSYFIGHKGKFADFVGQLLNHDKTILLVGQEKDVIQTIKRLIRIGFINIAGYNNFNVSEYPDLIKYKIADFEDLKDVQQKKNQLTILDIRTKSQWQNGVFEGKRKNIAITNLEKNINKLNKNEEYLVHCQSGYRTKIAAGILHKHNINFRVLISSFNSYKDLGAKVIKQTIND